VNQRDPVVVALVRAACAAQHDCMVLKLKAPITPRARRSTEAPTPRSVRLVWLNRLNGDAGQAR
jgi:hypothetical protein